MVEQQMGRWSGAPGGRGPWGEDPGRAETGGIWQGASLRLGNGTIELDSQASVDMPAENGLLPRLRDATIPWRCRISASGGDCWCCPYWDIVWSRHAD